MWANQLALAGRLGVGVGTCTPGSSPCSRRPCGLRPGSGLPRVPVGSVLLQVFTGGVLCGRHNGPRHRGDDTDELSNRLLGEEVALRDREAGKRVYVLQNKTKPNQM